MCKHPDYLKHSVLKDAILCYLTACDTKQECFINNLKKQINNPSRHIQPKKSKKGNCKIVYVPFNILCYVPIAHFPICGKREII